MQHCAPFRYTAPGRMLWDRTLFLFFMVRKVVENKDSIVIDVNDVIKYNINNISFINVCS